MTVTHGAAEGGVLDEHAAADPPALTETPVPGASPPLTYPVLTTEAPPVAVPNRMLQTLTSVAYGIAGFLILALIWQFAHTRADTLPAPMETLEKLRLLLSEAFAADTSAGPGIGLHLRDSIIRVFQGFALAALVGIPLGFAIGMNRHVRRMFNPIVQLLRPVSPLAWFPVGLTIVVKTDAAAVFTIFITSMWPVLINTSLGASSVPTDQHDVARVFRFSKMTELREVVIPHSLPNVITGLRLSMGIAWMVIVAAEMLSAASGIGFFIWQSYNGQGLTNVISAIIIIGIVGLILDQIFLTIGRHLSGEGTP
jgi:nitrate/nitrite transport system permease protein